MPVPMPASATITTATRTQLVDRFEVDGSCWLVTACPGWWPLPEPQASGLRSWFRGRYTASSCNTSHNTKLSPRTTGGYALLTCGVRAGSTGAVCLRGAAARAIAPTRR